MFHLAVAVSVVVVGEVVVVVVYQGVHDLRRLVDVEYSPFQASELLTFFAVAVAASHDRHQRHNATSSLPIATYSAAVSSAASSVVFVHPPAVLI